MGPGTAASLAIGGVRTVILSRTAESAERGLGMARDQLAYLHREDAAALLSASAQLDDVVAQVDLIIESAPENMTLKQQIFARLDAIAKADCILATNTSGLSITAIQSACTRPERAITTHFWNPPHLMPLVEIVNGAQTGPGIAETLRDLFLRCGKVPVIVRKDRPGQLGNRLQSALIREALYIVQEGIASVEDVDLAVMNGFGRRLPVYGVFEHLDAVGLDTACAVADYVSRDLSNHQGLMPILAEKRDRRETFYDWSTRSMVEVKARLYRFLSELPKG